MGREGKRPGVKTSGLFSIAIRFRVQNVPGIKNKRLSDAQCKGVPDNETLRQDERLPGNYAE